MSTFEELFFESKGKPVEYKGKMIQMYDSLKVSNGQKLKITIESADADWREGVRLDVDGSFEVNGLTIESAISIWSDTAPRETIIAVHTKGGQMKIRNIWDTGDDVVHSWHNGAAMQVEQISKGKRYKCNDGRDDDDFDDLIFTLQLADRSATLYLSKHRRKLPSARRWRSWMAESSFAALWLGDPSITSYLRNVVKNYQAGEEKEGSEKGSGTEKTI